MIAYITHGVNPYHYLMDVLQQIAVHPAKQEGELTPRIWKTQYADKPMLSDVNRGRQTGSFDRLRQEQHDPYDHKSTAYLN